MRQLTQSSGKLLNPLVSVVITTFNHAEYLSDAIQSVLTQTYSFIELIIVDDGSTDNTRGIVAMYPSVNYVYQKNLGLSSARNKGAAVCRGNYLVFLDADDILYPNALGTNLKYFQLHPECAFVSGGHDLVDDNKKVLNYSEWQRFPQKDHYAELLRCDYISMHGAVMYRREVFDQYHYDETLSACEDYDLYLKVAKEYPVFSHSEKIAAYRKHENSMSGNALLMYRSGLEVMRKNLQPNGSKELQLSYRIGKKEIKRHAAKRMYQYLTKHNDKKKYSFDKIWLALPAIQMNDLAQVFTKKLKSALKVLLRKQVPKPGHVDMGDLRRFEPLNEAFQSLNGNSISEYYIEKFIRDNKESVHGFILNIGSREYDRVFANNDIAAYDNFQQNDTCYKNISINDLDQLKFIPDRTYDCVVLMQVLQGIFNFKNVMKECVRILKPKGHLIITVPGISPMIEHSTETELYWLFTGKSMQKLLWEYFDPFCISVQTFGNVLTATAFLFGMEYTRLKKYELNKNDPNYQVIITAMAQKQ